GSLPDARFLPGIRNRQPGLDIRLTWERFSHNWTLVQSAWKDLLAEQGLQRRLLELGRFTRFPVRERKRPSSRRSCPAPRSGRPELDLGPIRRPFRHGESELHESLRRANKRAGPKERQTIHPANSMQAVAESSGKHDDRISQSAIQRHPCHARADAAED